MTAARPKILLVDNEAQSVEALGRSLRTAFEVRMATSGPAALELLKREPDIAILLSDLRLPTMSAAALFAQARVVAPDTVRILLTSHAETDEVIGAINEGHVHRFLKKPCPADVLRSALVDAIERHRIARTERQLLDQTLRGAVQTLCDTLALVNPKCFETALRVKRIASSLAVKLGATDVWEIETASMLCQLGAMTIPASIHEKRAAGDPLVPSERELVDRVPQVADQLLASIPRLDAVRDIVRHSRAGFDVAEAGSEQVRTGFEIPRGARILKVALDYEELETAGRTSKDAIDRMRAHGRSYDPLMLDALEELYVDVTTTIVEILSTRLLEGMVIAADVVTKNGTLLVARGHEVSSGLVRRLENFGATADQQKVRVFADIHRQPLRRSSL